MKLKYSIGNFIIFIFVIILYFLSIIHNYILPNNFNISFILLFGFGVILLGIFYFLLKIDSYQFNIRIKIIEESSIKTILIVLMGLSIFIPATSFSDVIIAWSHISMQNYFRGVIFIIGGLFMPGACIYNIILPKSTIHERLKVESFIVKLTLYPIISLVFLGSVTLALDFMGFSQVSIFLFLFFSIIFLFYLDMILQKKRGTKFKIRTAEITISKDTFLILIVGLGIIIVALGIYFSSHHYILAGDRWRGISSASLIGTGDFGLSQDTYTKYWGCISFGLSVLCGIPYINTNVFLFPFLYLSITSIYLFIKILLKNMNTKFCVLSSIFLVLMFDPIKLIFQFSFHSVSFFALFVSLTLFFIVFKADNLEKRSNLTRGNIVLLTFSSLFLVQSLMLYILPGVLGLVFFILYSLFSTTNRKQYLRVLLIFYFLFILLLAIFDVVALNFFSFWCFQQLSGFSGIAFNFMSVRPFSLRIALTSILFYIILLSSFFLLYLYFKFFGGSIFRIKKLKLRINFVLKKKYKYFFVSLFTFFSFFLLISNLDLWLLIFYSKTQILLLDFLRFYLNTLMISIGFHGIFGIYLSFFCFKENKNIFLFLFSWFLLIILLASSLIFIRWMQYPTSLVSSIPEDYSFKMLYLFSRIWYYSAIPLSIFTSIGLVKVIQKLKSRSWKNYSYKKIKSISSLFFVSLFVFLSFSTPITRVIYWDNYDAVTDEEAQTIGWISKNIPRASKILITTWQFKERLERDLYLYETYYFHEVMNNTYYDIEDLIGNLTSQNILYFILEKQYEYKYLELIAYFYTTRLYDYGSFLVITNKSI